MRLEFLNPRKPKVRRAPQWSAHGRYHVRPYILQRDGYRCQIQGERCEGTATQVDHIQPLSKGGSELPDNLRAACAPCNNARGNRDERPEFFRTPNVLQPRSFKSPSLRRGLLVSGDYSRRAPDGRR